MHHAPVDSASFEQAHLDRVRDVVHRELRGQHSIGYLDQDPRFYAWMTGRELLAFVGRAYGMTGATLRSRVDEVLEMVGLTDAARRRIGGYSGGMRQRLGVGQAVLPRPAVLFLDEPVSALDPAGRGHRGCRERRHQVILRYIHRGPWRRTIQ